MERAEGSFIAHEGLKLFYQKWQVASPKGCLVITHGQAEHSECYNRLAQGLADMDWNIYAWDLRGHGRSDGKRGFAESFNLYCDDFAHFYRQLLQHESLSNHPVVLLGHSMGGLIQLKSLINSSEIQPAAQVLSSPLLGLATMVSPLKENLGRWATVLFPEITLWNQIKYTQLSRDEQILMEYNKDPLRHDRISPQVYLGILSSISYVQKSAARIQVPTLMQIAGDDEIVSKEAALAFFDSLGSKVKARIVYESSKHEVYNDLDRISAYTDLREFLKGFER